MCSLCWLVHLHAHSFGWYAPSVDCFFYAASGSAGAGAGGNAIAHAYASAVFCRRFCCSFRIPVCGPAVYSCIQDDAWRMDRIPEIMDGKNVADYVDQDIDAKLALLEQEEDQLQVLRACVRASFCDA